MKIAQSAWNLSDRFFDDFWYCNWKTMSSGSANDGNYSLDNQESPLYTAKFDYQAQGELAPT